MVEFEFKAIVFVVKLSKGCIVYRDKAHLGGPWSSAQMSMINPSLDATFHRRLKRAMQKINDYNGTECNLTDRELQEIT